MIWHVRSIRIQRSDRIAEVNGIGSAGVAISICSSSLPATMSAVLTGSPAASRKAHSRWRVTGPEMPSTSSSRMP